jgi:septal ring factor EnvC (AmiA/AmiB activator)
VDDNTQILEALSKLDPDDDAQWTSDGLPRVEVVASLAGAGELKRADIAAAAPDFDRDFAKQQAEPAKPKSLAERLEDELTAQRAELTEVSKAIAKLVERKRELELSINYVGGQLERARGPSGQDTQAVQDYLATQRRLREEKAARIRALAESGVGEVLKRMGPSALDTAMSKRKPAPSELRREFPTSIAKE